MSIVQDDTGNGYHHTGGVQVRFTILLKNKKQNKQKFTYKCLFALFAYRILERIGARALSVHLRKLCDHLVFEVANSNQNLHIQNCVNTINDLIWKYNVITLDRLVLCLSLRNHEGNEAQVCFYVIQLLLLKTPEFRNRVQEFVKENSPDHWKQNNWYEKHLTFHQKFREKFAPDESVAHAPLTVYFGNACLRFLPVLDIVIHRFLEMPMTSVNKTLEVLLDHLGCLYKFHGKGFVIFLE